ncbi:MAG: hypothetical protein ABI378_11950 [Chitinophagaceae bacterium]
MNLSLKHVSSLLLLLVFFGCKPYEKTLAPQQLSGPKDLRSLNPYLFKPRLADGEKVLYRCHFDGGFFFKKFHLSGLLFFKEMEDEGDKQRVVFANEMGLTFFDFGWQMKADGTDSFTVYSILPKLNKPAVIKTLKKDIELVLLRNLGEFKLFQKDGLEYYQTPLEKGFAYFVIGKSPRELKRIDIVGKKRVASIYQFGKQPENSMPDSISIIHTKAHFTINAKRITDAGS